MPEPGILFARTLEHQELDEHVDEFRFQEPVLITAFEIICFRGNSACSDVELVGETWPVSFAVEFFARTRGDARFRVVCPAFTFSSASSSSTDSTSTFLETEVVVTDHIVLRGVYSSLTLVVYGNPIRELEFSSLLDAPLHSSEASIKTVYNLKLVEPGEAPELVELVCKLVSCAEVSGGASSALITSAAIENQDEVLSVLAREAELVKNEDFARRRALESLLTWLEAGLSLSHSEERFVAALAAIKLLCLDTSTLSDFVVADGLQMLIRVLQSSPGAFTVAKTFALQALELCSRHSFACEAIIGLKPNTGYGIILSTLLQTHRPSVSQWSFDILQRLRVYELVVLFQGEVDYLLAESDLDENSKERMFRATKLLSLLTNVLYPDDETTFSLQFKRVDLLMRAGLSSECSLFVKKDRHLFAILKERCLLSSIEAFLSSSVLQNVPCESSLLTGFLCTVQSFLVSLLNCEYGALFLGVESEAAEALMKALCSLHSPEKESLLSLKEARVLVKQGVSLCPQELDKILHASLLVLNNFENLIVASGEVDGVLSCLWNLVKLSRTQTGRHALQIILRLDDVLSAIMKVLENASASRMNEEKLFVASHYAAEILYVYFTSSDLYSWALWIPQASKLQSSLQALNGKGDEEKDDSRFVSRLLVILDSAMVFLSQGATELLRYSISGAREEQLGLGGSLLDDVHVLQLTTCMQMLGSICTPTVAAELIGEGAISILSSLLEYSVTVLQGESDQKRINATVKLVLPALLLLSKLSEKLQLEGLQNRNPKLLTALINLHRVMSEMLGACTRAPLQSWDENGLELYAALRLLASNLAYWLLFGWDSSLQHRLFSGSSPVETLSMLKLLGDLLPVETSPANQNIAENSQNLSAEIFLGEAAARPVNWHTQMPFKETLLEVLTPSFSQLADSILRLASTTCEMLFSMLKNVVIQISCASATQAATVLQPLLLFIEETSSATPSADVDIFRVDCYVSFLAEVSLHPASKAVILQLKSVKILCGALRSSLENQRFITVCWILKFISRLCLSETYMTFGDCCELASTITYSSELLPLDRDYEAVAEAFESLSRLRLGRAAFVAVGSRLKTKAEENDAGNNHQLLSQVMKRLSEALDAEDARHSLLLNLVHAFACGALTLAAAGKSLIGCGALRIHLSESEQDDDALSKVINVIERKTRDALWSEEDKRNADQVKKVLQVLLRVSQRPVQLQEVLSKVEAIASNQNSCKVDESTIQLKNHAGSSIHERVVESSFEKCKASFTWQCTNELLVAAPKRKASGIRNLRKRARVDSFSSRKQVTGADLDDDKNSVDMEVEPLALENNDDLMKPVALNPMLRDEKAGAGLVVRLGTNTPAAAPVSALDSLKTLDEHASSQSNGASIQTQLEQVLSPPPAVWGTGELLAYHQMPPPQTYQHLQQSFQMGIHMQQQSCIRPQQPLALMQHDRFQLQLQPSVFQQQEVHQFHPPPRPPRGGDSVQQVLASPEAIQDLLRDQERLTRLLEQHPRLLSLLQEKFNF